MVGSTQRWPRVARVLISQASRGVRLPSGVKVDRGNVAVTPTVIFLGRYRFCHIRPKAGCGPGFVDLTHGTCIRGNVMPTFSFFGRHVDLPARPVGRASTSDLQAWLHGQFITVQLTGLVDAVRVHTNSRSFSGRPASNLAGRWFAIGDIIQTSKAYQSSRSLPGPFTHVALAALRPGCVINVGVCSPLFGGAGGELQAEYVSGPPVQITSVTNKWHGKSASA